MIEVLSAKCKVLNDFPHLALYNLALSTFLFAASKEFGDLLMSVVGGGFDRHLAGEGIVNHGRHNQVHDIGGLWDDREWNAIVEHFGGDIQEFDFVLALLKQRVLKAITVAGVAAQPV